MAVAPLAANELPGVAPSTLAQRARLGISGFITSHQLHRARGGPHFENQSLPDDCGEQEKRNENESDPLMCKSENGA